MDGEDGFDINTPSADVAVAAAAFSAAMASSDNVNGAADPDSLMYSEFDLHCTTRKALQIHLLKQKVRPVPGLSPNGAG